MSTSDDEQSGPVEPTRVDAKALPPESLANSVSGPVAAPVEAADGGGDASEAQDADFHHSNTVVERVPLALDPKVAVESWSNDLPEPPEQPAGLAQADTHVFASGAHATLNQEPLSEPTAGDAEPPAELDDGWGSRELTGSETASHSLQLTVEKDATGSLSSDVAREAVSNVIEPGEAPRLVCIDGPDQGKEFVLTGRDVSIGRGSENDVAINDNAMSRVHCRILVSNDAVIVTDQRSANGTIVNGRKIDRATITSGSTIKLGGSLFRFIEMGDVIKSTEIKLPEAPSPNAVIPASTEAHRHRRLAFGIIGVAGVVALLIVLSSLWSSIQQRQPAQKPEEMAEAVSVVASIRGGGTIAHWVQAENAIARRG